MRVDKSHARMCDSSRFWAFAEVQQPSSPALSPAKCENKVIVGSLELGLLAIIVATMRVRVCRPRMLPAWSPARLGQPPKLALLHARLFLQNVQTPVMSATPLLYPSSATSLGSRAS